MLFIVPDDSPLNDAGPDSTGAETLFDDAPADEGAPAPSGGKVELDLDDAPFLMDDEEPEAEPGPQPEAESLPADAAALPPAKKRLNVKALLKDKRVLAGAGSALILLGVAAFFLFSSPSEEPPPPEPEPQTTEEAPKEPAKPTEYYIRWEPFWVEFTDSEGNVRFLVCRFAGMTTNETLKMEAEAKQLVLRDTIYYYLTHKDKEFLGNTANAEALKRDILAVVNQYLSSGQIDQVLLEDYVIK